MSFLSRLRAGLRLGSSSPTVGVALNATGKLALPSAEREPERYKGRTLILLLDWYVLDVIRELEHAQLLAARAATQRSFGGGMDWRATLRAELQMEETLDTTITRLWRRNQEIAVERGEKLEPVQFAKMIVDTNFAPLIERIG